MREASVLYTAAVEIFVRLFFQGDGHFFRTECHRSSLFDDTYVCFEVKDFHQRCLFVEFNPYLSGSQDDTAVLFVQCEAGHLAAWLVDKYLCFRFRFGVTNNAAGVILKDTEDVLSVEVDCHSLIVCKQHIDCGRIYPFRPKDSRSFGCLYGKK